MVIKDFKEIYEGFVDLIIDAYNTAPNPGIVGVEEFFKKESENGNSTLVEIVRPVVKEINSSRPWALGDFERERLLSCLSNISLQ